MWRWPREQRILREAVAHDEHHQRDDRDASIGRQRAAVRRLGRVTNESAQPRRAKVCAADGIEQEQGVDRLLLPPMVRPGEVLKADPPDPVEGLSSERTVGSGDRVEIHEHRVVEAPRSGLLVRDIGVDEDLARPGQQGVRIEQPTKHEHELDVEPEQPGVGHAVHTRALGTESDGAPYAVIADRLRIVGREVAEVDNHVFLELSERDLPLELPRLLRAYPQHRQAASTRRRRYSARRCQVGGQGRERPGFQRMRATLTGPGCARPWCARTGW